MHHPPLFNFKDQTVDLDRVIYAFQHPIMSPAGRPTKYRLILKLEFGHTLTYEMDAADEGVYNAEVERFFTAWKARKENK